MFFFIVNNLFVKIIVTKLMWQTKQSNGKNNEYNAAAVMLRDCIPLCNDNAKLVWIFLPYKSDFM